MSKPCSDQGCRPKRMKNSRLPPGVDKERCWCGTEAKVKEALDFADWFGMKFFMCANYECDPELTTSLWERHVV